MARTLKHSKLNPEKRDRDSGAANQRATAIRRATESTTGQASLDGGTRAKKRLL